MGTENGLGTISNGDRYVWQLRRDPERNQGQSDQTGGRFGGTPTCI